MTAAALVIFEFLALEDMIKVKDSSYVTSFDADVRALTYTEHLDWDLSFLGTKLSALVDEWHD